ncbi:hypothetical protein NQ317_013429 [Molorchus minor]|uniref:Phosphatidylinositol-glycan biosynthesis class X protein n=1 Tax=Molorchus minor TaxID=1323400 RepID=A0ABQ9JUM4_9CUCU|nr:hypothetical protein NQ317_013429 [Molorchus minor]
MITSVFIVLIVIFMQSSCINSDTECLKLDVSITQKVENEGFHRGSVAIRNSASTKRTMDPYTGCKLVLRLYISAGMYVNPDEVAELSRTRKLLIYIDGSIDVELPAHEATGHTVYVYLNNTAIGRVSVNLPVHLRYQRSHITGDLAKYLWKSPACWFGALTACLEYGKGLKVEAPCDETAKSICIWKNLTYQSLFDEVELFIPVGDLDDYPLVSIVTLLLGCAGCIYILSILSGMPL